MKDNNINNGFGFGVQPHLWPKRPSAMLPPSNRPLGSAAASFEVWENPYLMNNHGDHSGAGGSGTKTYFQLSDPKSTHPMAEDGDNKNIQNPSPTSLGDVIGSGAAEDNSVQAENLYGNQLRLGRNIDPNMDPKKLKRIISNRVSAQKSRMKKLQYVSDMERRVKSLEAQIAVLSPQVAIYKNQQHLLQMEQKSLKQQMSVFDHRKIITDAEIEEYKAKLVKLREMQLNQQSQMHAQARMYNWETGMEQMVYPNFNQPGMPQMIYMNSDKAPNGEFATEVHRLNQLNLTQQLEQQKQGQEWTPSWELGLGQMINPGLNQSGMQQKENINANLGGMDPIVNFSAFNSDPRNCIV